MTRRIDSKITLPIVPLFPTTLQNCNVYCRFHNTEGVHSEHQKESLKLGETNANRTTIMICHGSIRQSLPVGWPVTSCRLANSGWLKDIHGLNPPFTERNHETTRKSHRNRSRRKYQLQHPVPHRRGEHVGPGSASHFAMP